MAKQIPSEYHGREQTWLKHRVLSEYLRAWGQKLGSIARSGPVTIFYVDCFAGPWRSRDQDREDTSVAIGLNALAEAIGVWRVGQGADLRAHAIFVEANPKSAVELKRYVEKHTPTGVNAEVLEGAFADRASEISARIRNDPAFIFVDPTGWKGVGMAAVAGVARGVRRDVMVNVMYDHINRFKDDERAFLREQMHEFFAIQLDQGLSEDELMAQYREQLRMRSGMKFAADLAVPHPTRQRTYFRLVLGADHPKALELFRNIEHQVCGREAAEVREGARKRKVEKSTGQIAMELDAPELDARYARAHEEELRASRETLLGVLPSKGTIRFGDAWPVVLAQHHVRLADVKAAVIDLATERIRWERSRGAKQRTVQDDDIIALAEPTKDASPA
jgi:three-Cys-motif partner protein